jgi:hypothetical protein
MNSYIVKELKNGKFILCKILNEYDNKKEADTDMVKVATKKITEEELLEEYSKKKTF